MENVLTKVITEQVNQVLEQRLSSGGSQGESSGSSSRLYTAVPPAAKKRKTEQRLGNLLAQIRENSGSNTTSKHAPKKKSKKLIVRYERWNSESDSFKVVLQRQGGGPRILDVPTGAPVSFRDIKRRAVELYFTPTNYFDELPDDCLVGLGCISDIREVLPDDGDLWQYLKDRGIIISKTQFVLRTTFIEDSEIPEVLAGGVQHNSDVPHDTDAVETTHQTRMICTMCSCTYPEGESCLRCQQDAAYQTSLEADSQPPSTEEPSQANSTSQTEEPDEARNSTSCSPAPILSPSELRDRRLAHLQPATPSALLDQTPLALPEDTLPALLEETPSHVVRIRRSNVTADLINSFKNMELSSAITYKFIDPRGVQEKGTGVGVCRDVYASFWGEILSSTFIGNNARVPEVTHNYYKEEWQAVGRILCRGYVDVGYFPVLVSEAFMFYCLFGEPDDNMLLSSLMNFVSPDEKSMLEELLGNLDDPTSDDLAEFLDSYRCKTMVNSDNFKTVLIELARQELVQKPHIMADCWRAVFADLPIADGQTLHQLYEELIPTRNNVLELLQCNPITDNEREVFGYLKKYIKGLDERDLKLLVRFLTGSDLLVSTFSKIKVVFVEFLATEKNLARRPFARTCEPLLELPSVYGKFSDLRAEFESVIRAGSWEFDVI